jgi:hypothetical protein
MNRMREERKDSNREMEDHEVENKWSDVKKSPYGLIANGKRQDQ